MTERARRLAAPRAISASAARSGSRRGPDLQPALDRPLLRRDQVEFGPGRVDTVPEQHHVELDDLPRPFFPRGKTERQPAELLGLEPGAVPLVVVIRIGRDAVAGDDHLSVDEGRDVHAVDGIEPRRPGVDGDGEFLARPVLRERVLRLQDAPGPGRLAEEVRRVPPTSIDLAALPVIAHDLRHAEVPASYADVSAPARRQRHVDLDRHVVASLHVEDLDPSSPLTELGEERDPLGPLERQAVRAGPRLQVGRRFHRLEESILGPPDDVEGELPQVCELAKIDPP